MLGKKPGKEYEEYIIKPGVKFIETIFKIVQ